MRAVVQRVAFARVSVAGELVSQIERGLLLFLGVATTDTDEQAVRLARKVCGLRVFEDGDGKMNLDLGAVGGEALCVSQFTLYGDVRRGNRPSFDRAASAPAAEPLFARFCAEVEAAGIACKRGRFGAEMQIELLNDGPVTLIIDTDELEQPRRA